MGIDKYLTQVQDQPVSIPYIVLRGKWLEEAGFPIGMAVTVEPGTGKLVITPSEMHEEGLEDIVLATEPQKVSSFNGIYQGYTVNLRLERSTTYHPVKLSCSKDVYLFLQALQDESREVFLSIMMDNQNKVVGVYEISKGSTATAPASCFEVIKAALMANSQNIILAHNHPGGDTQPSGDDVTLTRNYQEKLKMMEMNLLDHVIIGYGQYLSMRDMGYIK